MNPLIRGWSNYFRIGVASRRCSRPWTASCIDRAQRYMQRRHPRKSGWWRTQKYWGRTMRLGRTAGSFRIRSGMAPSGNSPGPRSSAIGLVPTTYSPDDPTLQDYWRQRRSRPQAHGGSRSATRQPATGLLSGLSPGSRKRRGSARAPCDAQEPRGHGRPRESAACASHLPSPDSQQQCASWGASIA